MKCFYANLYMSGCKPNGLYSCLSKTYCSSKFNYGSHYFCTEMLKRYQKGKKVDDIR